MNKLVLLLLFIISRQNVFAQVKDSTVKDPEFHLSGNLSMNHNGMSMIPSFSLGKPAFIAELSAGKGRLSFDPQFRFDLDGLKPWSFVFWFRYKMITKGKFRLSVGGHPAYNFKRITVTQNGSSKSMLTPVRYFAEELAPVYHFSKHASIGIYYLHSYGADSLATRQTNFITLNSTLQLLPDQSKFLLRFTPQVYYLKMDHTDGYYASAGLQLNHKTIPVFAGVQTNKKFHSTIPGKDFVWNLYAGYTFNAILHKKQH